MLITLLERRRTRAAFFGSSSPGSSVQGLFFCATHRISGYRIVVDASTRNTRRICPLRLIYNIFINVDLNTLRIEKLWLFLKQSFFSCGHCWQHFLHELDSRHLRCCFQLAVGMDGDKGARGYLWLPEMN